MRKKIKRRKNKREKKRKDEYGIELRKERKSNWI